MGSTAPAGSDDHTIAVLDLGSNSFHMLIARVHRGEANFVDKLREPVRLADGLGADGHLSEASRTRALEALARFAQRIREFPEASVRVVGTNTLRRARNGAAFRKAAAAVLGHSVEVVSGDEEARLIYQGVAHLRSDPGLRRLVVDIGGGSTEVMLGKDFELQRGHSFYMGCVSYSRLHFGDGKISRSAFTRAVTGASLEIRGARRTLADHRAEVILGASGTCHAVGEILAANGWAQGTITRSGLVELVNRMVDLGRVESLSQLPGLRADRVPVIAGGVAVLVAIFDELRLDSMELAAGALREGVLYDLIGRAEASDFRDATVRRLAANYHVDFEQAERVHRSALRIADDVGLADAADDFSPRDFLRWASWTCEIGLAMSYAGFHRHGAYVVLNSFMPGFSRDDQALLATLIRWHRRRVRPPAFDALGDPRGRIALELVVILRLSVLLNRSRSLLDLPRVRWDRSKARIHIDFDAEWLARHPLTEADVDVEAQFLRALGLELKIRRS